MTEIEKQIIQNLVSDKCKVLSVNFPTGSVVFVVEGKYPELREKLTKTNPSADFVGELLKMAVDPNKCGAPCSYCGAPRAVCGECYIDNSMFLPKEGA